MPKYLTNTTFFNDALGTYIANGIVTTKKVVVNGDIVFTGGISNGTNTIYFNEEYQYINITHNAHVYGTLLLDYQGETLNVGQLLLSGGGGGSGQYPSITYNSSTGETSFTGPLIFQNNAIASAAIDNSDFLTYSTNQTVTGEKIFTSTQTFSTIQLDTSLIANSVTLPITTIANCQYLENVTQDINTDLNALKVKTTNIFFSDSTTTFSGLLAFTSGQISTSAINGTAMNLDSTQTVTASKTFQGTQIFSSLQLNSSLILGNGSVTVTNLQMQDIPTISTNKGKLTDVSYSSSVTTIANTVNMTNMNFTGNINGTFSKTQFDNCITQCASLSSNCQSQIDTINSSLSNFATASSVQSILDDKIGTMIYYQPTDFNIFKNLCSLGEIQYTDGGGNKINMIPIVLSSQDKLKNVTRNDPYNYFDINSNANVYGNLKIGNIQNAESLINAAMTEATAGLTAALIADGIATGAAASALTANTTANGAASAVADLAEVVEDHTGNLIGLNQKTANMSLNNTTNVTNISGILKSDTIRIGDLDSGLNQITDDDITLNGYTTINNTLYLGEYNTLIVDGIINQTSTSVEAGNINNQLTADTSVLGTLTVSGNQSNTGNFTTSGDQTSLNSTNTQIGTNAISTLTINSNTTCNGDITMLTTKNLRLKNIVPVILDDIMFGDAAGTYNDYDTIFNTQIIANRPLTLNADFQQGTNAIRKTYLGYNDTYTTYASTSATVSSPSVNLTGTNTNITSTATLSVSSVTNNIISSGTTSITGLTTNVDGTFVNIGNVLSTNILYGSTYVQALYSPSGTINAIGTVMQQFV